jgi:hypothetical protein
VTYVPKSGDRVRATQTIEGTVTRRFDGIDSYIEVDTDEGGIELHHLEDRWTFEKLQDPEPKWVNGDVVEVAGAGEGARRARVGDKWLNVLYGMPIADVDVSTEWRTGQLEILYKADQDAEAPPR